MQNLPSDKKIILFDGVCNLCNDSVNFVIQKDVKNQYLFAALQSKTGKMIVDYLKIDPQKTDSILLYEPGISYYVKSEAALKIMESFGGFWKVAKIGYLFPKAFRDFIYDQIAKNRYKWFGKKAQCMVPTPQLQAKFLD